MEFITDRTKADVLQGTAKGFYGAEDLNRVESAVKELVELVKPFGINKQIETKTDWDFPEVFSADKWPTKEQMARYINNVHIICGAVDMAAGLPNTMERLTWDGANQIEIALQNAYKRVRKTIENIRYSGEIFAEEESYL